jgi:hypothetical protein
MSRLNQCSEGAPATWISRLTGNCRRSRTLPISRPSNSSMGAGCLALRALDLAERAPARQRERERGGCYRIVDQMVALMPRGGSGVDPQCEFRRMVKASGSALASQSPDPEGPVGFKRPAVSDAMTTRNARYKQTPKGKAANRRYRHSAKGKATDARYKRTRKYKAWEAAYRRSERGKAASAKNARAIQGKTTGAAARKSDRQSVTMNGHHRHEMTRPPTEAASISIGVPGSPASYCACFASDSNLRSSLRLFLLVAILSRRR